MIYWGVLPLALVVAAAAAAGDHVRVLASDCRPASIAELDTSGAAAWVGWQGFVDSCPLRSGKGAVVLSLVAPSLRRMGLAAPREHPFAAGPLPPTLVVDRSGNVLARLGVSFPYDDPGETRIAFSDWRRGFPWRIDVRRINAAVFGTYSLDPLIWDPRTRGYEERPE